MTRQGSTERSQSPTDRQLAAAIRFGRKVTVETPDLTSQEHTGYVMGFDEDDIHLALIRGKRVDRETFNRSYIGRIYWHPRSTLSSESVAPELEALVKSARTRIVREYWPELSASAEKPPARS